MALTIREVSGFSDFLNLRDAWNGLLRQSDRNTVFLTWEWLKSWWEVFGQGKRLRILAGYSGGELVGLAPFMMRMKTLLGGPVRSVEFIGSGDEVTPDHLGLIARSAVKAEFTERVFSQLKRDREWDVIHLCDMAEDPLFGEIAGRASSGRHRTYVGSRGICPYLPLPADWDEVLNRISSSQRNTINRKERQIVRDCDVAFYVQEDADTLDAAMDILERLHRIRMGEKQLESPSLHPNFWEFHRKVARLFLFNGWLLLGMLRTCGTVSACQYSFQYNNTACFYQSGLDPAFSKYSLGSLMTGYMIRESVKRGFSEYDFLRGAEPYKFHWTDRFRENREFMMWNSTPRGEMVSMLYDLRRLGGRVKRNVSAAFSGG